MTTKLIWFERFVAHELRDIARANCSSELLAYHRNRLSDELELCKKEIFKSVSTNGLVRTDVQSHVRSCQKVILHLMDVIYDQDPDYWRCFEESKGDQILFLIFQTLENLRSFLKEYFQSYYDHDEKASSIELALLGREVQTTLDLLQTKFFPYKQETFFEALVSPLLGFLIKTSFRASVTHVSYLRRYMNHLMTIEVGVNQSEVQANCVRSMFRYNLNSSRVFDFVTSEIQARLDSLGTQALKIQLLHTEARTISQYYCKPDLSYRDNMPGLKDQLKDWIFAEMEYLRQESEIQQAIGTTIEGAQGNLQQIKLRTNLSVNELALLIRLFIEAGMIPSENIAGTLKWAASNLESKKTTNISHESLRSKYYEVSTTSLVRVDKYLEVMKTILKQLN